MRLRFGGKLRDEFKFDSVCSRAISNHFSCRTSELVSLRLRSHLDVLLPFRGTQNDCRVQGTLLCVYCPSTQIHSN